MSLTGKLEDHYPSVDSLTVTLKPQNPMRLNLIFSLFLFCVKNNVFYDIFVGRKSFFRSFCALALSRYCALTRD